MRHTDPPCAACEHAARQARTLRGRLGSLLIDIGLWLGGVTKNDPRRP